MADLDNPILEPSERFYGTDNEQSPEPEELEESSEASLDVEPEETEVESEESEEVLVYEIDGEEVPEDQVKEWKQGYLRHSDYTKKTQELSERAKKEASKIVAEKLGDIDTRIKALSEHTETLDLLLKEVEGTANLDELREDDYEEYLKTKETIENRRLKLDKAKTDAQKALEQAQQARIAEEQAALFESRPEWTDKDGKPTKQRDDDFKLINEYAKDAGYTDVEFAGMTSHKFINTMLEAAHYRQLKSKTPATTKKVRQAPKLVKPSVKKPKKSESELAPWDKFYAKK